MYIHIVYIYLVLNFLIAMRSDIWPGLPPVPIRVGRVGQGSTGLDLCGHAAGGPAGDTKSQLTLQFERERPAESVDMR